MRIEEESQLERSRRGLCGGDENVLFVVSDGSYTSVHISKAPETEHQGLCIFLDVNNTITKNKNEDHIEFYLLLL